MTFDAFLLILSQVKPLRSGRYVALCPAHADSSPSLSVMAGDKAVLLRCWAGCTVKEIMRALKLPMKELFYDTTPNPAAARKARERKAKAYAENIRDGKRIDARRNAEYFIRSRRGLNIAGWSDARLDKELNNLATAYGLLETENFFYDHPLVP